MHPRKKSAYVVVRNGINYGPFSATQLRQLARANDLLLDDLVCRIGTDLRTRVRKIEGLSVLINQSKENGTNSGPAKSHVTPKAPSALLHAVRSYRNWQACRRSLAHFSTYCISTKEMEPLLAVEIATRDQFTQAICRLFPIRG